MVTTNRAPGAQVDGCGARNSMIAWQGSSTKPASRKGAFLRTTALSTVYQRWCRMRGIRTLPCARVPSQPGSRRTTGSARRRLSARTG